MPAPRELLRVPCPAPGVHPAGQHCPTQAPSFSSVRPDSALKTLPICLPSLFSPLPERGMLCKPPESLQSPWEVQKSVDKAHTGNLTSLADLPGGAAGISILEQGAQHPFPRQLPWLQHPRVLMAHPAPPSQISSSGTPHLSLQVID